MRFYLPHLFLLSTHLWNRDQITFLSLNRFERKKNTVLAINAFGALPNAKSGEMRLVLAGGYDPRVADNVECLATLLGRCVDLGLTYKVVSPRALPQIPTPAISNFDNKNDVNGTSASTDTMSPHVLFILNFTHVQRTHLLTASTTRVLLYTPQNEHFGIGPVEAMVCGVPVIACNSGGPVESIIDPGKGEQAEAIRTGYLLPPVVARWTEALLSVLALSLAEREKISAAAQARVEEIFSLESMTKGIEGALEQAARMEDVEAEAGVNVVLVVLGLGAGLWLSKVV